MSLSMSLLNPRVLKKRKLPRLWFFTDARLEGREREIIARLPAGTGVVLRNYGQKDRASWAQELVQLCRARRLVVLLAGDARLAFTLRADGVHWPEGLARTPRRRLSRTWIMTVAVHGKAGIVRAGRSCADGMFLSPVFATLSHPGAPVLGAVGLGLLLAQARCAAIALGGINRQTARAIRTRQIYGLAAISGWES